MGVNFQFPHFPIFPPKLLKTKFKNKNKNYICIGVCGEHGEMGKLKN